jgi:HEXXH motif-containing protein
VSCDIDTTIGSPDFLLRLGSGQIDGQDLRVVVDAVRRRRVRLLEAMRRQAVGVDSGIGKLIEAWFRALVDGTDDAVVADPFVAMWAEATLRGEASFDDGRMAARLVSPVLDLPKVVQLEVEAEYGRLHLAGCGGTLHLGNPGRASIWVAQSRVTIESNGGGAVISPTSIETMGTATWIPTVRIQLGPDHAAPSVELSAGDPSGGAVGPTPALVPEKDDLIAWERALTDAWGHIVRRHPEWAPAVATATAVIVPQAAPSSDRHVSSSSCDGFGAVGLSFTEDVPTLAVALVHEARHALLGAALTVADLYDADSTARFYVGWRDDPRPIGAVLQGVCAFSAVTSFWRTEHRLAESGDVRRRTALELIRWWTLTGDALGHLRASGGLTELGARFVDGLEQLTGEPPVIEPEVALAAADLSAEHRIRWLIQHRSPSGDHQRSFDTTTLAQAWNERLFTSSNHRGPIHPVDRALTRDHFLAGDLSAAAYLADADSPADAFRFARALERLGRTDVAGAIVDQIERCRLGSLATAVRSAMAVSCTGPRPAEPGWCEVADVVASVLNLDSDPPPHPICKEYA